MSSALHLIRTIIFYFTLTAWTVVWACIIIIFIGLFPFHKRHRTFIKTWAVITVNLCKVICGVRWNVSGQENIPDKPCVVMSNHQSTWETFFIQTMFSPQVQVVKQELLRVPFFGWALATTKPIAINRTDIRQSLRQIREQGIESLKRRVWVLIFPEGTRKPHGQLGKFSRGGAGLAKAAESKILPVAHNAGVYWPNTSWIKRPGTIQVVIGPSIDTTELSAAEATNKAKEWIAKSLSEMN